jgi:hypothetical protein
VYYTNIFYKDFSEIKPVEIKKDKNGEKYVEKDNEKYFLKKIPFIKFLWDMQKVLLILSVMFICLFSFMDIYFFLFNIILSVVLFSLTKNNLINLNDKKIKFILRYTNMIFSFLLIIVGILTLFNSKINYLFFIVLFFFFEFTFLDTFYNLYVNYKDVYYLKKENDNEYIKGYAVWQIKEK